MSIEPNFRLKESQTRAVVNLVPLNELTKVNLTELFQDSFWLRMKRSFSTS